MTKKACAECNMSDGIRIIIWGMPDSEPDPNKFYMGGCTSEGEWHKYKCIKCGWEGSQQMGIDLPEGQA